MGMNISAERAAIYRSNTLGEKAPIYFLAKRMFVRYPSLPSPPPSCQVFNSFFHLRFENSSTMPVFHLCRVV